MITEAKRSDIEDFNLGSERKYIWADSNICHYCARYVYPDKAFDDGKCEGCGYTYSKFLGVEALTWRE